MVRSPPAGGNGRGPPGTASGRAERGPPAPPAGGNARSSRTTRVNSRARFTEPPAAPPLNELPAAPLPAPRRAAPTGEAPELLDRPGLPHAEAERALVDLERVYRRLFGGGTLRRLVLAAVGGGARPWCLDLGAGGGHVGADLVAAAARRGAALRVVGVDAKLAHLLVGRRRGSPQRPVVAEAGALPFAGGSVECAFSHLLFHHFDAAANREVLLEMRRVARRAVVVVDLARDRLARLLVRPCLRLLRLSATAYHDGVVSVARSYRPAEVAAVVAGLPVRELRRRFPCRWSLVIDGSGTPPPARQPRSR